MSRLPQYLLFLAIMFAVPLFSGCGGKESTVVTGNDQAAAIAEEEENEYLEDTEPGKIPVGGATDEP